MGRLAIVLVFAWLLGAGMPRSGYTASFPHLLKAKVPNLVRVTRRLSLGDGRWAFAIETRDSTRSGAVLEPALVLVAQRGGASSVVHVEYLGLSEGRLLSGRSLRLVPVPLKRRGGVTALFLSFRLQNSTLR